jgi:hypothetical protein
MANKQPLLLLLLMMWLPWQGSQLLVLMVVAVFSFFLLVVGRSIGHGSGGDDLWLLGLLPFLLFGHSFGTEM